MYYSQCFICEYVSPFLMCRPHRIGKMDWMVKVTSVKGNFDYQLIIQIILIVRSFLTNYLHEYFDKYCAQLLKPSFTELAHIWKKKVTLHSQSGTELPHFTVPHRITSFIQHDLGMAVYQRCSCFLDKREGKEKG